MVVWGLGTLLLSIGFIREVVIEVWGGGVKILETSFGGKIWGDRSRVVY